MLSSLHIENIAVIKKLDADFSEGFTVLTGETGAGKSILIDSIAFLLGGKAQKELIRVGENTACVSGLFSELSNETVLSLGELGIAPDEDGSLMIQKTMSKDGKATVKINGRTVTSSVGRACGMLLINIHGQHDNQVLLNPSKHIEYLDRFAENSELLEKYRKEYSVFKNTVSEINRLAENQRDRERTKELLSYQINDIENASLVDENEEEELISRKKVLQNAKKLGKSVLTVYKSLYKNSKGMTASQLIEYSIEPLEQLSEIFPEVHELSNRLSDIQSELEAIAKQVGTYMPSSSENPEKEIEEINDRLDVIRKLKRKYGNSIKEILAYLEKTKLSLTELETSDEKIKELEALLSKQTEKLSKLSSKLHKSRLEAGDLLSKKICEVLAFLDMSKVMFSTSVLSISSDGEDRFSTNGSDTVEFYISTNIGEPMKPLARIASGGELARIMLAIKCVLANAEAVPTIIFDEVDTGVSGKTSQKIGIKLHNLSKSTQVISITHSAQIAASADNHFKIQKNEVGERVETSLLPLDRNERIAEIARIIGGVSITTKTLETAEELLESAK